MDTERIRIIPIDEGTWGGRGGRATSLANVHGAAVRAHWILGFARHLQNLLTCELSLAMDMQYYAKAVRSEWVKFKHILQCSKRKKWQSAKLNDRMLFNALRNFTEDGAVDWADIYNTDGDKRITDTVTVDNTKYEWSRSILQA